MTRAAEPTVPSADRRRGQLAIAGSAIAWSTAGVLQRGLTIDDAATQMAGRAFVAAVVLSLLAYRSAPGRVVASLRSTGWTGLAVALCMAGASATFIVALNRTTVANVLLVQALSPFIAVILAWLALRERASRRTWVATAVALAGVGIMVGGPGRGRASGFVAAAVMTVLFAVTIVVTRHRRDISMAPAVAFSQVILFLGALPFADFSRLTWRDLVVLSAMGVFQTGLGQTLFVLGARLITAAEVALITMLEVVLGPVWVWLFFSEQPAAATLLGGVVVLAAVIVQTTDPAVGPEGSEGSEGTEGSDRAVDSAADDAVDLAKGL